jgi:hypothetical protein
MNLTFETVKHVLQIFRVGNYQMEKKPATCGKRTVKKIDEEDPPQHSKNKGTRIILKEHISTF